MKKNVKVDITNEVIKPSYSTTVKTRAKRFAKTTAYCAGVQLGAGLIVSGVNTIVKKVASKKIKKDKNATCEYCGSKFHWENQNECPICGISFNEEE